MTSFSSPARNTDWTWLRPSVIEGWRALSRQVATSPHESVVTAVARLKASYATAGLDYLSAEVILDSLGPAAKSAQKSYQALIEMEIERNPPVWLSVLPRGRLALLDVLTADARECFKRTGALATQPAQDAVDFLDRLANVARGRANLRLVEAGRGAERKSFDLEVARCATIPNAPQVEWVSLDDNSAGFDIRSSRAVDGQPHPKLIEVKACRSSVLQMILTRNEWQTACRYRDDFVVHLWNLVTDHLHELSWVDLQPHMPVDQGDGRWDSATLVFSGLRGN